MMKAAVIGTGMMGRNHVRVYAGMESVKLVAVADPNESSAMAATHGYRTTVYTDFTRMLDHECPDLVSVAVPTQYHTEVAREVIGRGIHLLVEKPLALTQGQGREIVELAADRGVKLMVGHIERFNPAIVEIKRRLQKQDLGRLFQIHARRLSPFPARIQDVGVVLDLATHDIDVMRCLLGSEVERVYAEIERKAHRSCEDLLSGLVRFTNGVIGVLDINWLTPTKVRQLTVLGEGGMYLADYLTQDVYWYKNSQTITTSAASSIFRGVWEGDMVKIHFQKKEPLRAELDSFVEAVRDNREPYVNGRDALMALGMAQKLVESGHSHAPVYLQPIREAVCQR